MTAFLNDRTCRRSSNMAARFDIAEAKPADAAAIASLFALSWVSPFSRLQFGQADPAQLAASMVPRITEQMVKMNAKFIVAIDQETREIAAVAQWTVPIDGVPAAGEASETQENSDERQQFEDEVYRRSLPENSNKALVMEFTIGLRQLREQIIRGRNHYHLENLATHPNYRGMGLASRLIGWVFPLANEQQQVVYLETASDNPATRLYAKLGFEERGQHTIKDLSKFASIDDLKTLGCELSHTHVGYVRYPSQVDQ